MEQSSLHFLVTGGSRGLGRAIALQAIRQGHRVSFTYQTRQDCAEEVIKEARQIRSDAECRAYQLDLVDRAQIETVADDATEKGGDIGVLVNCAGILRDSLLVSMRDEDWDVVLATNLTGPMALCRYIVPQMMANGFGRVVNISSVAYAGASGQSSYAASKAGLHGLTLSIAKEYGRRGITANLVVPGVFDTDMSRETIPPAKREFWTKHCPMPKGRVGMPEEIASTVIFLASPSTYINGEVLHVTGGLNYVV